MKSLKLNLVTDHHLNSGIGRYSFELSKALIDLHHNVSLFKPYKQNGDDIAFDQKYSWIKKIQYKSLRSLHPYLLPYFIGGKMFPTSAHVFHGHWFMAGLGLLNAFKKKIVITMHDVSLLHEKEKSGDFTNYYKKSLAKFKERGIPIIVVSNKAKEDAIHYGRLLEDQVFAVHNGINFNQFFPIQRKPNGIFKIIYSGGLSPRKNVGLLLQACRILEDRGIDYQLEIAGNHPDYTPYPKMAAELLLKNVNFIGFVPDDEINNFYNSADLMVYTSKYEGFGFAPLEAMASGTPVISTKGGSLSEISGGGANMVDDDPEEIAEAIIKMKESSELRAKQIVKGFDWVVQYTWKNSAKDTLEVYNKVA